MGVVAIIPARGGSKGIPGKNLRRVGGVPLVVRSVRAALAASGIDRVIVTTDDQQTAEAARAAGADIVERPAGLAGDGASSESALLHALDQLPEQPEIVVLLQPTSPFIDPADLDGAVAGVRAGGWDVLFSAVPTHAFLWRNGPDGASGVNHDASVRPMRQEREPHYRETGAFYVLRAEGFRTAGYRFFGRTAPFLVDERGSIEIDTPGELEAADALEPLWRRAVQARQPLDVDAVVTDFDGVHTDDRVLVASDGSELVVTNRSDGMGVRLLCEAGIPMLILSTEANPVVAARAAKLRVEVVQGSLDKEAALRDWAAKAGHSLDRIAYLGNDVNDLGCFAAVGWPVAVADARPEARAAARLVLGSRGGAGAVRELADRILASRRAPGQAAPHQQEES